MVVYAVNLSTWEAEAGESHVCSWPAWSNRDSSRTGTKATQKNSVSKSKQQKTKPKKNYLKAIDMA